jgi:predicted O-methyltransferase YrrM
MQTEDKFPDWFSAYAKPNFEKYLLPLAGKPCLRFLQLGVYTGDATRWLDFNVLTNPDGLLIDIDTWEGSDEDAHEALDFNEVYLVYQQKITKCESVCHYRMSTDDFFINTRYRIEGPFDFIYVDADHTAVGVLLDAEHAWPWVKPGGLLAFDDYQWGAHLPASKSPKLGIDLFLERHAGEYEILEQGLQVWLRKL